MQKDDSHKGQRQSDYGYNYSDEKEQKGSHDERGFANTGGGGKSGSKKGSNRSDTGNNSENS